MNFMTYRARWAGTPSYRYNNEMYYFPAKEKAIFGQALREFYCSLVSEYLKSSGSTTFVEDSTWNITYISSLSEIFSEAKFVHVYRDPRDVVASFVKTAMDARGFGAGRQNLQRLNYRHS